MSARPCDDVAVIVRAPASAAPIAALIAECSDSTSTSSPCARPCATNVANPWMIGVCGVIGYIGTTSGSICRIASATAWPPVRIRRSVAIVLDHRDRIDRADDGAELAAFANVVVEADESRAVEPHRRVRAVEPAEETIDAAVQLDDGLEPGPPAAGARPGCFARADDAGEREVAPNAQLRHAYPSSTAFRIASRGTFAPSRSTAASTTDSTGSLRSEERRVGKECRSR